MESVGTHTVYTANGKVFDPKTGPGPAAPPTRGQDGNGNGDPFGPGVVVKVSYDSIAREGALVDPLRLIDGARIWGLNATDGQAPNPQNLGAVYALELLLLTGLTTGGLFLRYRKVGVA